MEIKKCENCGSKHIHVITKEIGYSCSMCGRNTVRLNEMYQTNADRIRAMSDEELADFIRELNECCLAGAGMVDCSNNEDCIDCKGVVLEWLQSEEEE